MALLHLRVVCPSELRDDVHDALCSHTGAVAVRVAGETSDGIELTADVARESVDDLLDRLRDLRVDERGLISTEPLDTTLGGLADRAERDAPGDGADALIWDELAARGREDSTLTGTFLAFMVLATVLAAIGVVTDSQITIVGAMVVRPEFGPLAAIAVGIMRRDRPGMRRALTALAVGFPVALVAGTAGMLSLTSSKSSALVGVFVSVTTIPAAGNASVAAVLGNTHEMWLSLVQLAVNLTGIVAAALITLLVMNRAWTASHRQRPAEQSRTA